MPETPELRFFDEYPHCACGRRAEGVLYGSRNQSFGAWCEKCAHRRLAASAAERDRLNAEKSLPPADCSDNMETS